MGAIQVWEVSRLLDRIQEVLQSDPVLADVWIEGEVTNHKAYPTGHQYFSLKDADGILSCVLFFRSWRRVQLANGDRVMAHGRVTIHTPRGQLQLVVDAVQPQGVGELQLRFEQLRARLEDEGLFAAERKRPLPPFPQRIGIVTSASGAVLHDVSHVLARRYPLATLVVAPTAVQGPEAGPGIVRALAALNEPRYSIDVIVLARGGGSLEELWAFNEEAVARAIFASRVPVVSGVGHETDVTIADFVADVRAPTPSAAAELVTPARSDLMARVAGHRRRLAAAVRHTLTAQRHATALARGRLAAGLPEFRRLRQAIDGWLDTLRRGTLHHAALARERLGGLEGRLATLDPLATLGRGYAIVTDDTSGRAVRSAGEATRLAAITVSMKDGAFGATVRTRSGTRRANGRQASVLQSSLALEVAATHPASTGSP